MAHYKCSPCGYVQDFEPTLEKMRQIFYEVQNIRENQCPACGADSLEPIEQTQKSGKKK